MKYYLIAGEASGDLHASRLMNAIKQEDKEASFRYIGGNMMSRQGGTMLKHYKDLAYMGFIPVLFHLPTILRSMALCKRDIAQWQPDIVILIDYPGFNLNIAKHVHRRLHLPIAYYISPKIWAWKEWRIKQIKRDIDRLYSILPFEKDFYERRHGYPISYVGNPTVAEVAAFKRDYNVSREEFCQHYGLDATLPMVALLPGSRRQEIKDNLPAMLQAMQRTPNVQAVLACAPAINADFYSHYINNDSVSRLYDKTYELLSHADVALVTSGTATLETALFNVPQVVCYKTPLKKLIGWLKKRVLSVRYVSLVNLIADRYVVPELVAETFSVENITRHLRSLLPGAEARQPMLDGYKEVRERLGEEDAAHNTARQIIDMIFQKSLFGLSK